MVLPAKSFGQDGLLTLGNLSLNLDNFQVTVAAEPVQTTFQEFELLRFLMRNQDRIIPLDVLTSVLWPENDRKAVRRLNVVIHRLRAKLRSSAPYQLETVRSRGYGLIAADRNGVEGGD